MSKRRKKAAGESPSARLWRIFIPGTTGGLYTLGLGALGLLAVLGVYVHAYATQRPMPEETGELLLACVGLLGAHTARGINADRVNAANGLAPVPVDPTNPAAPGTPVAPTSPVLPDLRPLER